MNTNMDIVIVDKYIILIIFAHDKQRVEGQNSTPPRFDIRQEKLKY